MTKGIKRKIKNNKVFGTIIVSVYRFFKSIAKTPLQFRLYCKTKEAILKPANKSRIYYIGIPAHNNLGDLAQDYGNYDEDVAALQSFWRKFSGFTAPAYTCVGNHDLRTTKDRAAVAAALGYEKTSYSFDEAGLHVVVLGTDVD